MRGYLQSKGCRIQLIRLRLRKKSAPTPTYSYKNRPGANSTFRTALHRHESKIGHDRRKQNRGSISFQVSRKEMKCPRGSLIFLKDECVYNQPIIRIFEVPMLWYPGSRQGRDRVPCFPQNSLVESSGI